MTIAHGNNISAWRQAMGTWRKTGDVTPLAEVASRMDPSRRRVFLDIILPASLRQDLESLLRRRAVTTQSQAV